MRLQWLSHFRAPALGQLNGSRPHTTGSSGNKHVIGSLHVTTMQHVLSGSIGTGDGCQFFISPVAIDRKDLACRDFHILRECTVKIGRHPDIIHRFIAVWPHAGAHQNTLAQKFFIFLVGDRLNHTATIRTLDKRKRRRLVPPAIGLLLGYFFLNDRSRTRTVLHTGRIPAKTRIDFGIVYAGSEYFQEHFARAGNGYRSLPVFKFVVTTISGCYHGKHGFIISCDVKTVQPNLPDLSKCEDGLDLTS